MAGLFSAWSIFAADFSALLTTSFETRWHLPEFFFFVAIDPISTRSGIKKIFQPWRKIKKKNPECFFNPKFLKKNISSLMTIGNRWRSFGSVFVIFVEVAAAAAAAAAVIKTVWKEPLEGLSHCKASLPCGYERQCSVAGLQ